MEITTARYINVNGSLLDLSQPRVMGILNVTPDSFYAGSRTQTEAEIVRQGGDGTVAYGPENTF